MFILIINHLYLELLAYSPFYKIKILFLTNQNCIRFRYFCPRLLYGVLLTVNVKSFETKNNKSCYFVSGIYEMHFRQLL